MYSNEVYLLSIIYLFIWPYINPFWEIEVALPG